MSKSGIQTCITIKANVSWNIYVVSVSILIKTIQELIGVVNLTIFFDIIYIKIIKNTVNYMSFT